MPRIRTGDLHDRLRSLTMLAARLAIFLAVFVMAAARGGRAGQAYQPRRGDRSRFHRRCAQDFDAQWRGAIGEGADRRD